MNSAEIQGSAIRLAQLLQLELQRNGVAVPSIAGPDDALRAAEAAQLGHDKRVVALHRCLYWIRSVALRNEKRDEMRRRLGAQWAEAGFSQKDEKIADRLLDIVGKLLELKEPINERQQAREDLVAKVYSVPVDVKLSAKHKAALVALIELGLEFDSSFGKRPRTVTEWGDRQVDLEIALYEGGFRDAEIAKLFGRPEAAAVRQARYRRFKKAGKR